MQQTTTYHLSQWDAEDRILRSDFNADNAKLEAALLQSGADLNTAKSQLTASLTQEQQARAAADASVRQDLSASIAQLDSKTAGALAAEQATRAQQDTAIRQEFAAADAALSGSNLWVKLSDITTSASAPQVDLSLSGIDRSAYSALVIIPRLIASCDYIFVRANSIASSIYYAGSSATNRFGDIYSFSSGAYATCYLYSGGNSIACRLQNDGSHDSRTLNTEVISSVLMSDSLAPASLQTLNFITNNGSAIYAGSRILIYGVRL